MTRRRHQVGWASLALAVCAIGGIEAEAATIEVPAESPTIQAAIFIAAPGDVILVAPGTYVGLIDTLGKAIELRSEAGPEVTILDGGGVGRVLQVANNEGPDTIIDGFTITNGAMVWGAGMINFEGVSPTVRNCIFENNTGEYGAGMANYMGSNPIVENCVFRNNSAILGGGMNNFLSSPTVVDCVFENNAVFDEAIFTEGGAVAGRESFAVFERCSFLNNHADDTGGAVHSRNDSVNTFIECLFVGNTTEAGDGGAIGVAVGSSVHVVNSRFLGNNGHRFGGAVSVSPFADVDSTFVNCEFVGNWNTMFSGGALYARNVHLSVINSSFVDNTGASSVGGGIAFSGEGGSLTVRNSIFRGNETAGGASFEERSQLSTLLFVPFSVENNIIDQIDVYAGNGNFNADPMFVDAAGPDGIVGTLDDDLRLASGSPCIDAGDNGALPADAFDLDGDADTMEALPLDLAGNVRQFDDPDTPDTGVGLAPIVDLGAYEYVLFAPPCPADLNGDGAVNGADLATLLSSWNGGGSADLNGDGVVNGTDLASMLSAWGACAAG